MGRKIGFAIMAAGIAYAVLRFGAGTVAFKPGLDIDQLTANAHAYGVIGAVIVAGLALAYSSPVSREVAGPERRVGIAMISAAIAYAVLAFGAGTVAFKPGLDVEQLKTNAHLYGLIGSAVVGGLVLAILSPSSQPHLSAGAKNQSAGPTLRELEAMKQNRSAAQPQRR